MPARWRGSRKPSHMWVGERAVFLHLEQLGEIDDRERVLLALGHLGLQRRIDLVEVDAGRRGAERLEHRGPQRADGHAEDLEALEVVGPVDRMRARGDLAVAVVPHVVERGQPGLGDRGAHRSAERAVHRGPHLAVVSLNAKPMALPLIEASGTSRPRGSGRRGSNIWIPRRCAAARACRCRRRSWLLGKIWMSIRPDVFLLDLVDPSASRLRRTRSQVTRGDHVVGVLEGELGRVARPGERCRKPRNAGRGGRR